MTKKFPQLLHSGEPALSLKAKNESASSRLQALVMRSFHGLRRTYHSERFPALLLASTLVLIASCISVYIWQQRRSMQMTVATVQQQLNSYPLRPKDEKLDDRRISLFIQPVLGLAVLIALVPFVLIVRVMYKNPSQHRSTMLAYGFFFMFASATLVGLCYVCDYTAFYALTEKGYVRFEKHYNMMVWMFTLFPGGTGLNLFVGAMMKKP